MRPNIHIRKSKKENESELVYGSIDWWLFATVLTLLCLGLLMVLSAGGVVGERNFGDQYFFFKRQMAFVVFGLIIMLACIFFPRKFLNKLHYPTVLIVIILLVAVLTPLGIDVNGAKRWLPFLGFSLQPMEFARIALVLYLAYFLSTHQELVKTFSKGVIPPFAITGLFCLLLLLQPDFGAAIIMLSLLFFLCLAGGTRFIYLAISFGMLVSLAVTLILNSPYRMRRLLAFMDPFKDAQGAGYQLVQSFYALADGGFFGVGMGNGRQKLLYLPEAHNDFIMSVIGEELGLLGISFVMVLFIMLFTRCYHVIVGQPELRDKLTAFGLTLIIVLGSSLNLAVIMGMVPPKGVSMPFLSYGGSSMLASLICVGILLNYSRTTVDIPEEKKTQRTNTHQSAMQKLKQHYSKN